MKYRSMFEKYHLISYGFSAVLLFHAIEFNFFPGLTSVAIDVSFVETFIAIIFCALPLQFHSLFILSVAFDTESITPLADSAHANAVARIPRIVTSFTKLERTSKAWSREKSCWHNLTLLLYLSFFCEVGFHFLRSNAGYHVCKTSKRLKLNIYNHVFRMFINILNVAY